MRTLTFQSIAPSDYFEFAADGVFDADHGVHLEYKCGEHGAELVNRYRIVAFDQHVAAPLAHTYDEKLDLEIAWGFPLTEYFENPLLGILIFHGRTLRTLEPADYVFHLAQCTRLRVAVRVKFPEGGAEAVVQSENAAVGGVD